MITKTIGLKEFRQNITSLWKKARAEHIRYIVLHHSEPVFEVNPIQENTAWEELIEGVHKARQQIMTGEVYTDEEVRARLDG